MQFLIVGLGNPETRYQSTRHNVGFMINDALARTLNAPPFKLNKNLNVLITTCETFAPNLHHLPPVTLILAKPQTFMNLSGTSVAALVTQYKNIDLPKSLITISDDLDLPFGTIRFRARGSAGGHNGLKSIIESLGTQEFPRLKIGIRPPGAARQPGKAEDFVLERFTAEELATLKKDTIPQAVAQLLEIIQTKKPHQSGTQL